MFSELEPNHAKKTRYAIFSMISVVLDISYGQHHFEQCIYISKTRFSELIFVSLIGDNICILFVVGDCVLHNSRFIFITFSTEVETPVGRQ